MIKGLLSEADKERLWTLVGIAKNQVVAYPASYIEIGSLNGLSASIILSQFGSYSGGMVLHCFDFFENDKLEQFRINLWTSWARGKVFTVVGNFIQTLPVVLPGLPDVAFAFVDHDHAADTTEAAWNMLLPRMAKGGILAFHDYGHPDYPGGTRVLAHKTHWVDKYELPTEGSSIIAFTKP